MDLEICFLLIAPFQSRSARGTLFYVPPPRDAPYFFDLDIEFRSTGKRQIEVEGIKVGIHLQILDGLVWVAECRYWLEDALGEEAVARKRAIQTALRRSLLRESGPADTLMEEYIILLMQKVRPAPDEFVDQHAAALARLLRSLPKPLSRGDMSEILRSRARYSASDLTVVDWNGAIIIAEEGDFQPDIELLKLGNYQLLRYRMLDQTISHNLQHLRQQLKRRRIRWFPAPHKSLQTIVEQRLELVVDFEKIDQSLLLIGDWYSARVYRLIVDQFCMDEWKAAVSFKLDSLATIDEIVHGNLAFSWRRALDLVQLVGWLILLVGYFVLFFTGLN